MPFRSGCVVALLLAAMGAPGGAQVSEAALRFFGTGIGPPGQQDRVLLAIDDNSPGASGSTSMDLGASDFTLELWVRGRLADNPTANAGGEA